MDGKRCSAFMQFMIPASSGASLIPASEGLTNNNWEDSPKDHHGQEGVRIKDKHFYYISFHYVVINNIGSSSQGAREVPNGGYNRRE